MIEDGADRPPESKALPNYRLEHLLDVVKAVDLIAHYAPGSTDVEHRLADLPRDDLIAMIFEAVTIFRTLDTKERPQP